MAKGWVNGNGRRDGDGRRDLRSGNRLYPSPARCKGPADRETPCRRGVIGRVLSIHIADRYVLNRDRGHVDTDALDLVARSFGSGYLRTHDGFQLDRPTWTGLSAEAEAVKS